MRMIPSQPLANQSRAEQRVFDQLRSAFSRPDQSGWFAMHSLNLPRHEYKRFGEIDFIVCGPKGIYVLEVKGGGVACHEGVWETTNRYGETERLRESPFKQAEGALHGLRGKLPHRLVNAFVHGYGVIMPDVEHLPDGAEWDRTVLADRRDFREFERWIERLIKHWHAKDSRKLAASPEDLDTLRQQLRPDFEAVMPLHAVTHDVETRVVQLTADQMRWVDVVEANLRVICQGGAGTGKTMLAIELAKRWTSAGLRVVLTCHSPWLKQYLERNAVPGLDVTLSDSIRTAARRAGVEKFDALIVDEGQDVLNMDTLSLLDAHVRGGLHDGRWCFFHDVNNQSGLCGSYAPDAYDYLNSFDVTKVPLRTNCRSTLQILNLIQTALGADVGTSGVGDGPQVREVHPNAGVDVTHALANELSFLIDREGLDLGGIVLLSGTSFADSCASRLPNSWLSRISVLDAASSRNDSRATIGFARIDDFKGLESEVVVLVDLPRPGTNNALRAKQYVGMSRARALLSIIDAPASAG
jgi:hypothetical protein